MKLANLYQAMLALDKAIVFLSDGLHKDLVDDLSCKYDLINNEYCEAVEKAREIAKQMEVDDVD